MKDIDKISIRQTDKGAVISIKAVPGASRDKIASVLGNSLKITTSAAAEKGKANSALIQTFAKTLKLDKRSISVHTGQTNPHKEFLIENISTDQLRNLLEKI